MTKKEKVLKNFKTKYEKFIKTDFGKKWIVECQKRNNQQTGSFEDYLYDFYPEMLA